MDTNRKASKSGEVSMTENQKASEVVVVISSGEDSIGVVDSPSPQKVWSEPNAPAGPAKSGAPPISSCPSPEIARYCPSPNKPPKIPTTSQTTLVRRKSLKPKSRFGEPPIDTSIYEENSTLLQEHLEQSSNSPLRNISNRASPNNKMTPSTTLGETLRTVSFVTPKTPLMASPGGMRGEDEVEIEVEEICKKVSSRNKLKYRKVKMKALVEWVVFFCILGCLVASVTVDQLQQFTIWGLEIWKWCVLVMVTTSGMLVTKWFIKVVVFLVEKNYLFRKKVLYFVHSLKKSVQFCIWLCLVLITWSLLFDHGVKRSPTASQVLKYISWTIVTLLIGTVLWVIKTLLLKILASSLHVNTFFDRIQESIFHQYIVQTLSLPPVMGSEEMLGRTNSKMSIQRTKKGKEGKEKEVIDMNKVYQIKREKVSAGTMKMLVDVISSSQLSTISNALDESVYYGEGEQADKEITNEMEAIAAAYHIFRNVAQHGCNYIDEMDLRKFLIKEEVDLVFPLFEGAETGRIARKALTDWVVKVYKDRKALGHALDDTKTAVKQLGKLIIGILVIVMIIVWLLLMEIATTKVLLFLSSQLVVAAFMFGNTCKTIFEAIIFVFVMHPFDVGDRCVIDGVQMIVEEMNILTTVFLRFDNEKVYYPNSVLATKPISNFYRSPDMGDSLEFSIDFMTPLEKIGALKEKIKKYLEKNSLLWYPNHNVVVKEIENVNKIKMAVFFTHTMNFQNFGEKSRRRSELVLELKKIFEDLGIKYNLLPQDVHLVDSAMPTGATR